ncbi:MAG TPA: hypothetical protein VKK31_11030 [Thermoanaerobaculia bacterium]|nr:hypothetical protein [Thermoanaerobaculia bacterium]
MHKSERIRGIGFRLLLAVSLGVILVAARGHDHLEDGFALLKKGKYDKAKQHFYKAIDKFKEKGMLLGVFMGYEGLGDVARAGGQPEEALALYQTSLQYSRGASWDARNRVSYKSSQIEDEVYQQFVASAPKRWETYEEFLATYPANHNGELARRRRDELQYAPYLKGNTLKGFVELIDTFPDNVFLPKALDKVYAIWQSEFGTKGASDALGDYDQFLRDFPSTRLRAAAMTMRSYYAALLSSSPSAFAEFFVKRKIAGVPLLGSQEIMNLTDALERLAEKDQAATPFLLLYENTGQKKHLQRAAELVRTAQEESYFVKTNPRAYFGLGEAGNESQIVSKKEMLDSLVEGAQREGLAGLLVSAYIPKLETTARPAFDIPIYSRAALGSYKVELEFTMKVRLTWRFTGLLGSLGQLSGQESSGVDYETYTARTTANLAPRGRRSLEVVFQEITTSSQQSFVGLAGVEQTRDVIELTPRITSAILTGPSGAREWKVEINTQDLQTFNEAARQFNTLASMNRSTQIDEWEQTLVAGVLASASAQGPPSPRSLTDRGTEAAETSESREDESPIVISGTVYCKGWQYERQRITVSIHTDLNWSDAGAFQTDNEGNFSFSLPLNFNGPGLKSLKFVGSCGEDTLRTSQSLEGAAVKLQ